MATSLSNAVHLGSTLRLVIIRVRALNGALIAGRCTGLLRSRLLGLPSATSR